MFFVAPPATENGERPRPADLPVTPAGEPIRVLIVDDEVLLSHTLSMSFRALDYTVVGVGRNGEEAVSLVREHLPDVVTMDVRMPTCDGLEATRRIMAEQPTCIIVLTAFSDYQGAAKQAGAMGYAVKPLFPAKIPGLVESARRRFARCMEIRKAQPSREAATQTWLLVQAAVEILCRSGCPEDESAAKLQQSAEAAEISLLEAALRVIGRN